jgi:hypothetical protein
MPHVVIEGPASVDRFFQEFQPILDRSDGRILKARDVFINQSRRSALVESTVVEGGHRTQGFFVHVAQGEGAVTVRLLAATDPEKTDGVKRLLAILARKVLEQDPSCRYGKTNLEPFLIP